MIIVDEKTYKNFSKVQAETYTQYSQEQILHELISGLRFRANKILELTNTLELLRPKITLEQNTDEKIMTDVIEEFLTHFEHTKSLAIYAHPLEKAERLDSFVN